jgi:hypothetical protein
MLLDAATVEWLRALPLHVPVVIDGVTLWLKPGARGAVLLALLEPGCSEQRLQAMLCHGFRCALEFDAGFGLGEDGVSLCLLQWLPGVGGWLEAAEALAGLLDQVDTLRLAGDPVGNALGNGPMRDRTEQRLRRMFEGGNK